MSWLAIGAPGASPILTMANGHSVEPPEGEVVIALNDLPEGHVAISQDGKSLEAYVPALDLAKTLRWSEAKAYRDDRMGGQCPTPAGVVQIDDSSKLKLNGAVNMAMLATQAGQAYAINWTMADNGVVALDAKAMIAMGVAVGRYVAACQDACSAIRAAIEAAADADALQAIDITQGYPAAS